MNDPDRQYWVTRQPPGANDDGVLSSDAESKSSSRIGSRTSST
jgi:hypothetical protein